MNPNRASKSQVRKQKKAALKWASKQQNKSVPADAWRLVCPMSRWHLAAPSGTIKPDPCIKLGPDTKGTPPDADPIPLVRRARPD